MWKCFWQGHQWTPWRHWSYDAPRIVRASMECMNDPTEVRNCLKCSKKQSRN